MLTMIEKHGLWVELSITFDKSGHWLTALTTRKTPLVKKTTRLLGRSKNCLNKKTKQEQKSSSFFIYPSFDDQLMLKWSTCKRADFQRCFVFRI